MTGGRRAALDTWYRFVGREGHVLRLRPHLLLQQAVNGGRGSPLSDAAEARCRTSARPLIEWDNRPDQSPAWRLSIGSGFSSVTAFAVSADGRSVIAGSDDGSLREWDAGTGRECHAFPAYTDTVLGCWYSHDAGRIISAGRNRQPEDPHEIRVWDRSSGSDLTIAGVRAYACSSTEQEDLVLGTSGDSALRVWRLSPFEHLRTLTAAGDDSVAGDFAPDGGLVAAVGQLARIWDRKSWAAVAAHPHPFVTRRHGQPVVTATACRLSPDASAIALAGRLNDRDAAVLVLDVRSGCVTSRVDVPGHRILSVAFDGAGRMLAVALGDGTLSVRDLPSGAERCRVRGHADAILACAFAAGGREIVSASADGWLRVWRLDELESGAVRTAGALALASAPDGQTLAVVSATRPPGLAVLTPEGASASILEGEQPEARRCVAFCPDGTRLVTGSATSDALIVDRDTRGIERRLGGLLTATVRACDVSPDGRWILAGSSWPDPLVIWDEESGEPVRALGGVRAGVNACTFSPDGALAAACWEYGPPSLQVWDLTGRHEAPRPGDSLAEVSACAFSPDGRLLAACSDHGISVWDLRSSACVRSWPGARHHGARLAFSRDGSLLVVTEGATVRVLAIEDGAERGCFPSLSYVHAVAAGCRSDLWVGTSDRILRLRLRNLDTLPAVVTATRFYDRVRRAWSARPAARCRRCGILFDVPAPVVAAIDRIGKAAAAGIEHPAALDLPCDAWDEPALRVSCPRCHSPLIFNPFECPAPWAGA